MRKSQVFALVALWLSSIASGYFAGVVMIAQGITDGAIRQVVIGGIIAFPLIVTVAVLARRF